MFKDGSIQGQDASGSPFQTAWVLSNAVRKFLHGLRLTELDARRILLAASSSGLIPN